MLFLMVWGLTFDLILAQPEYVMQNALVEDCEGILTDSQDGPETGQYNHNENLTFTICVDQASEIIIAFRFFATEPTYDILRVYDGPGTGSPLIATLTGIIQPPPVLVATSGCVTFHFISDANIVAAGWELSWSVEIEEPQAPVLSLVSMLDCPMDAITFQFDIPVDCDMLSPSNFTVLGPGTPSIASIQPLDCMSGVGQIFQVVFASPLNQPGTYRILFNGAIQDVCGEWHDVSANIVFDLTNCPFDVEIQLVTDACAGDCGSVRAQIIGNAGVPYVYQWSHTPLNQSVVDICVSVSTLISITVTDPVSMSTATASYTYVPRPNPVILNPVQDTVCSSRGDHIYQSSLPGGRYYSTIIPESLQEAGRYQFFRWNTATDLSIDIVTYVAPNGCEAYDTVYVLPVNAGSIEAACVNSADFVVGGGTPVGGVWTGPHITSVGVFSPVQTGSFVVTYTAPNGCAANKRINVEPGIIMPDVDTICSSQEFDLVAEPYGGRWSGPGIVNSILGRIRPWTVPTNQTYRYIYTLQGCRDTMYVYIQELWAGPDRVLCDSDSLLVLPDDGTWTGPGVWIPALNAFDISMLGPGEYDYTLSAFGCSDAFRLYIIRPYADVPEPVAFCLEDEWIPIWDFASFQPWWSSFSGPATAWSSDVWYFNPAVAGPGTHTLVLEAVGCRDSFLVAVEPYAVIPSYSFCELSPALILSAVPSGGTWTGPGFLDGQVGLFDPQLLPPGMYPVTYTAPSGCVTETEIEIIVRQEVSVTGLSQLYCFKDTLIQVQVSPADGMFFINGNPSSPEFNPAVLGSGTHELFYTRGSGPCGSSRRVFISITDPISGLTSLPDSICYGENTVIQVQTSGGTGTLTSTWDMGIGFGSSHIVNPLQTTMYTVMVTDGCSDPFVGTSVVHVHQPFDIQILPGPAVCYDDTSHVEIVPPHPDLYAVYWSLDSLVERLAIAGRPGIYMAEVVELLSGCSQTYDVVIPGPPPLRANFITIPNQSCIDIIDNTVQVIDLSTGYTEGWIDFGDGSGSQPYSASEVITHDYVTIGNFEITLILTNALGCMDTLRRTMCVENRVVLYVPNVFSPNRDGTNDVFAPVIYGVRDVAWSVFTRSGDMVFGTSDPGAVWDGTFNGVRLNPGVYAVQVRYTDQDTGQQGLYTGSVTLVR